MTDTHEILCEAVQRIAANGWHQSTYFSPSTRIVGPDTVAACCVLGSLVEITDRGASFVTPADTRDPARLSAFRHVCEAAGVTDVRDLATWNDDPDRTVEDVLDVLGAAIADESDDG